MEQAGRITSQHLLELGLRDLLQQTHPKVEFFLFQPEAKESPLFGPSMGFDASRAALRFGYGQQARSTRSQQVTRGPSRGVSPADHACSKARYPRTAPVRDTPEGFVNGIRSTAAALFEIATSSEGG